VAKLGALGDAVGLDTSKSLGGLMGGLSGIEAGTHNTTAVAATTATPATPATPVTSITKHHPSGTDKLNALGDAIGLDTSKNLSGLESALNTVSKTDLINLLADDGLGDEIKAAAARVLAGKTQEAPATVAPTPTVSKDTKKLNAMGGAMGLGTGEKLGGLENALKSVSSSQLVNLLGLISGLGKIEATTLITDTSTPATAAPATVAPATVAPATVVPATVAPTPTVSSDTDKLNAMGGAMGLDTSGTFSGLENSLNTVS
jgi:hypothetical protein